MHQKIIHFLKILLVNIVLILLNLSGKISAFVNQKMFIYYKIRFANICYACCFTDFFLLKKTILTY